MIRWGQGKQCCLCGVSLSCMSICPASLCLQICGEWSLSPSNTVCGLTALSLELFALPLQVLDIREKSLHPNHAEVAASLNNLAVLLKTMGNFDEAEQLYHRSIAIKERALGQNHPQVSY